MRQPLALLCFLVPVLAGIAPGCSRAEPEAPPASGLPACEPRSNTDPARLTVEASAEDYGLVPPCEATVSFAIPRHTRLGHIHGHLQQVGPDGQALGGEDLRVVLQGPDSGILHQEVSLAPVDGVNCRDHTLNLEQLACSDRDDQPIECPDVRIRHNPAAGRLTVRGADLDVCVDE